MQPREHHSVSVFFRITSIIPVELAKEGSANKEDADKTKEIALKLRACIAESAATKGLMTVFLYSQHGNGLFPPWE